MKRKIDKVIMMVAGVALLAAPAMAQVLFSDDFSDGNRDGWYMFQDGGVRALDVSSNYLETVSDGYTIWGAAANFPAADLSLPGSSVQLTLDFQIKEDLGSRTISMGLYDSNGTQLLADVADKGAAADDSGYFLYNGGNSTTPRYWLKAGYNTGLGDVNGSTSLLKKDPTPFTTADGTWHTFSLTLTRTVNGILVEQVTDEGLPSEWAVSAGDVSGNIASINQVAIQAIDKDFAVDNIVVTYQAPPENPNVPVFIEDPIVRANGTNGVAYSDTIAGSATDADGDTLTYSKVSGGPSWLSIGPAGALSGTPGTADEGTNSWTVSVSDGFTNATATLNIVVDYTTNHPPVFSNDPTVIADGRTGVAYSGTLSGLATDVDSDPLTFTKQSGPPWLNIATNGVLSGTPGSDDVGPNSWTVEVSDGLGGTDTATLEMTVLFVSTLFSDDFSDGNRDGWYMTNTNGVRDLDASGGTLAWSDPANTYGMAHGVVNFPAADLSNVGDRVQLSLDFQILENLGSRVIGIGLWDSAGTTFTSDVADLGNGTNDVGYFVYDRDTRYWLKDSTGVGIGSINGTTSLSKSGTSAFAITNGWHTYELTLERKAGGMLVTLITDKDLPTETILGATSAVVVDSVDQVVISTFGFDYMIDNVLVTGVEVRDAYGSWAFDQGLTTGVNDGYGQDPDLDTMDNLLEYALGANPTVNDATTFKPAIEVAADGGSNYLNYVYRRMIAFEAAGLTYTVKSGTDLVFGGIDSATEEAGSAAIDADFESVTNRVPTDVENKQFMQLNITIE